MVTVVKHLIVQPTIVWKGCPLVKLCELHSRHRTGARPSSLTVDNTKVTCERCIAAMRAAGTITDSSK